jgi:hypothetical protein
VFQDKHEQFDIHKCGSTVLHHLDKTRLIPFRRVAANRPDYEICRLFLSTLQLVRVLIERFTNEPDVKSIVQWYAICVENCRLRIRESTVGGGVFVGNKKGVVY